MDSACDDGPDERPLPKAPKRYTYDSPDRSSEQKMKDHRLSPFPNQELVSSITWKLDLLRLPLQRQVEELGILVIPCLFDEFAGKETAITKQPRERWVKCVAGQKVQLASHRLRSIRLRLPDNSTAGVVESVLIARSPEPVSRQHDREALHRLQSDPTVDREDILSADEIDPS